MKRILSIIAPLNYQDKEYGDSKMALEAAGHSVITASTVLSAHGALGGSIEADMLLSDINPSDYDAVIFVGGGGCFDYFDDPTAQKIAKDFFNANKITAAICAAPSIFANAELLNGVTATCFPSQAEHITEMGANYTGAEVEQDGLMITASGPLAATKFGERIAEAL
mgnify:CR=1 FL=1